MKPLADIELHSIVIGQVGSGIQFHVGQKVRVSGGKEAIITHIVRDENSYEEFKEVPYIVYGEIDGEIKVIKFCVNQPVYVSCITEL